MQTTAKPTISNLYNPHEQNKAQLIERFTVRQREFKDVFQNIKPSQTIRPKRPYLIEGQRGMGKTTLLLRLSYEIENDPELSTQFIPIVLKEEAYYGIRHLFKLWELLAHELEGKERSFYGLSRQMQDARQSLQPSPVSMTSYEQTCFEMLVHALRSRSQKILLCVDNLGEMLRNFSDQENLRFREILTHCPYLRLIGATSVVFEAIQDGKLARIFHNVFHIIQLKGLSKAETHELFLALAKTAQKEATFYNILAQHPGRIEALRILTGGVIRTLILLFEIFVGSQNQNSLTDLDDILDRVTPLYQSRMNDLTPLQRDVVNAIALNWDAVTPKDIAGDTCMHPDEVLAVLRELEQILIVRPLITENHHRFYQLNERFFNIWYLMRLAPGDNRSRVLWLLHFLESWYDQGDLNQQARKHTEAMTAKRSTPRSAYYLTEALVRTGQLDMSTEHRLIQATRALLQEFDADLTADLSVSDKDLFNEAEACYQHGDYEGAAARLLRIKHKNDRIYLRLGESLSKLARYDRAIQAFRKAIDKDNVDAMLQLAELYYETLKDYHIAETYYVMAVEHGSIEAMFALGNVYYKLKDYAQAETYYRMILKEGRQRSMALTSDKFSLNALKQYLMPHRKEESAKDPQSGDASRLNRQYVENIKRISAEAIFQLGNLYAGELNDPEKAIHYYNGAIKIGNTKALVHLAMLYQYTLKDYRKAVKYYILALKKGEKQYAAVNLGILYQNIFKDNEKAERYYLLAIKNGQAAGMNGLAWLYFEQRHHKQEALRYAEQAADKEKTMYTAHTLACIYLWNNQPEDAVRVAREFMYDQEAYTYLNQDILLYLMLLLAQKHYRYFEEYFETPDLNLRERFKPLYYAFLYHTKHPDYYKRPPELIEPIGGIIGRIQRLAASYA